MTKDTAKCWEYRWMIDQMTATTYCTASIGCAWRVKYINLFCLLQNSWRIVLDKLNCLVSEKSKLWFEVAQVFPYVVSKCLVPKRKSRWNTRFFNDTSILHGSFSTRNTVYSVYDLYHAYGPSSYVFRRILVRGDYYILENTEEVN